MSERTQNTQSATAAEKLVAAQLETALKALAKLLVSIKFYPTGHPALKDVTSDAKSVFAPLFQTRESVAVVVRRTGFFYGDEPVGSTHAILQKLAVNLFARRIQQLMILQDLSCRDLWETAKILLLDADVIQKKGGIQSLLHQARVTTIWTNTVDINGIFELKNKIEEEKSTLYGTTELTDEKFLATLGEPAPIESTSTLAAAEEVATSARELPFEDLLKAVEMASDEQEFSRLLHRLIPVVQGNLTEKSAHLVLQTLSFLTHCSEDVATKVEKRKAARQALTQLSTSTLLSFYINLLCARRQFDDHRIAWDKITRSLGDPLAKLLLNRLAAEEDPSTRKVLSEALISQGEAALAAIVATLNDDRWSVLRNAAQLLGEIRAAAAIEPLRDLLHHRDLRVRREALRALTRIGGNSVITIIAKILQGDDSELRRQAMLCLGAIKNPAATIPLLIQFLQVKDWRFLQLEEKIDAIRALGEIGSAEALPELMSIVNHRCLFYRSRNNVLRAAALLTIGEIGGGEAIRFLETMEEAPNPIVQKAAISALKQARKGSPND